jgi:uncharacterized protein (TIGR04255 family)
MVFRLPSRNKAAPSRSVQSIAEFSKPPLDEVVVGIQFNSPPHLRSVHYGELYRKFMREYPVVEDQPKLPPNFEAFGGNPQVGGPTFHFGSGASLDRVWMVSNDGNHLVQFQEDRFLLNWRRRAPGDTYPRYEKVISSFEKSLETLSSFFENELKFPLQVTQAEVSYINLQPIGGDEIADWINVVGRSTLQPELMNLIFTEVLIREEKPTARAHYMIQSAIMNDGAFTPAFRFEITCRGAPKDGSVKSALAFIDMGREHIVRRFCELTTAKAHDTWGRTK